jgi:DNA-binding transcriptional regulator WhiA
MNSLYGRFGMRDDFNEIRIVNQETLNKLIDDNNILIKDIIKLSEVDFVMEISKNNEQETISLFNNLNEFHNTNIAIATFVTSYARIFMSQFKNNEFIKLFYTDTDSIIISLKSLNDFLLGLIDNKELGKLKLEYNVIKGIFLAPKLYCLLTDDNQLITKTRGLSHNISLNMQDFENLL